jgi:hypothetical protein
MPRPLAETPAPRLPLPCIASRDDGRVCRTPATVIDPARGGVVCPAHAPGSTPAHPASLRERPGAPP